MVRRWLTGLLGAASLGWAAGASATTLTLTPDTWGYRSDDGPDSAYQTFSPNPGNPSNVHEAFVGEQLTSLFDAHGGWSYIRHYRAATAEFTLPSLPENAIVAQASLTIAPLGANSGAVWIRDYQAANVAYDPSRIYAGSSLTAVLLGSPTWDFQIISPVVVDVTSILNSALTQSSTLGDVLGFSFRKAFDSCTPVSVGEPVTCYTDIGNITANFRETLLSITYDVPAPTPTPTSVPEPASWALMAVGLGMAGGAIRRRRTAATSAAKYLALHPANISFPSRRQALGN